MNSRSYTPTDLVEIPRVDARGALALGEELTSAARPFRKNLPANVAKALTGVQTSVRSLGEALRDQVGIASDRAAARRGDRKLDGCWGGLHDFLGAVGKLEGEPFAPEARELESTIFPNGLRFLTLPYKLQWSESEMHLQRIERDDAEERIVSMGGAMFLHAVRRAHREYGQVLGIKAPKPGVVESPKLRESLLSWGSAVRLYVVRVVASVEPHEPETEEVAAALLAPLHTWDLATRSGSGEDPAGGEDEGLEDGENEELEGGDDVSGDGVTEPGPAPPNEPKAGTGPGEPPPAPRLPSGSQTGPA